MRSLARTALVVACLAGAQPALAQRPTLRVLEHVPNDSANAGSVILITFDRPVAGALDRTVDPARIFKMSPAVPGVSDGAIRRRCASCRTRRSPPGRCFA